MSKFVFPEDITREYLDELAERVTFREAQYVYNKQSDKTLNSRSEKIAAQVNEAPDLLADYTEFQYVQQEIEITPGLKAGFRTLIPQNMDDALDFASENAENADNYTRVFNRMRLAYGIETINGRRIGEPHFPGSYFESMSKFETMDSFLDDMRKAAQTRYNQLSIHGLSEKVSEAFALWENAVWEKINDIDDFGEVLKKSTGDSATAQ